MLGVGGWGLGVRCWEQGIGVMGYGIGVRGFGLRVNKTKRTIKHNVVLKSLKPGLGVGD